MIHYANPDETTFTGATFEFHFGAYGDTVVRVFQRPDRVETALETAAEWLVEHAPGFFVEPDYAAARAERGCDCGYGNEQGCCEACAEHAEADLTRTEHGLLPSWEWTVDELDGEPFDAPRFDRFDVCEAHAAYQAVWHQGQWSQGYRDLCRAKALLNEAERWSAGSPWPDAKSFDALSENGQAIYRALALADARARFATPEERAEQRELDRYCREAFSNDPDYYARKADARKADATRY